MTVPLAPVAVAVAGALRAGVRVHVVAGYDVDAHVRRRPVATVRPLAPRDGHRRLAAAVVEQADVGAAEVPIGETVDDVVKAGLGQPDPDGRVEHAVRDEAGRAVREDDAERQPKDDEDKEAVEVGAGERQVPGVGEARLKVGQRHCALHVHDDADVRDEG